MQFPLIRRAKFVIDKSVQCVGTMTSMMPTCTAILGLNCGKMSLYLVVNGILQAPGTCVFMCITGLARVNVWRQMSCGVDLQKPAPQR